MAENELGGLALIAANYGADDQDLTDSEDNATQPTEERMEVEPTTTSQNDAQKSPQNSNNSNRARLSFKLTKGPSPVRRTLFSGSQAADPPTQSFNNSQIAPAPRKFLSYGDRTRSAPAVLTNHVAPFPGLDNLGNTCYINSVLQVLYHAKEFRSHLHNAHSMNATLFSTDTETAVGRPLFDGKNNRHVHIARDLISEFLDLFEDMDEGYHKLSHLYSQQHELDLNTAMCSAIAPKPLMRSLGAIDSQFGPGTEQQDVQEFIRVVLGHLDDADKTCLKVFSEVESHIKRRKRSYSDMMSDAEENGHSTNGHEHNGNGHSQDDNEYHNDKSNGDAPPFKKQRLVNSQNGSTSNGISHTNGHSNGSNSGATTPKYLSPLKKSIPSPAPETRLSYIERLFQGCSVNSIKCLECENVSARSENFLDLSLTIQKGQNLMWSIGQFASSEQLRGDNKYSCENCRTHTEAVKSTKFGALPRILTIHFKRFRHEMYSTEKINHHIPSPLYMKLDQWCEKTCKEKNNIYELFGIIFHQGSSMSYGHYFSYLKVKRPTPSKDSGVEGHGSHILGTDFFSTPAISGSDEKEEHSWIHCDDETVTFKTEKEIMNLFNMESRSSSTAYILFYRSLDDQDLHCIDSAYLYKHLNKV